MVVVTSTVTLDMLRQISLFSQMSDYDLRQVVRVARLRDYRAGTVIIEELEQGAQFYIIHSGKIEITKGYGSSNQFVLGVYSDGDFFGEMALLDEGRRSATVVAVEPTTLLEISKDDFQPLLHRAPVLAYNLLRELSFRLRTTGALLVSYLQQRNRRLRAAFIDTLRAIRDRLQDSETQSSTLSPHTTGLARMIGVEMGLSKDDLSVLELRSLLHDLAARTTKNQEVETLQPVDSEEEAPGVESRGPISLLEREISDIFRGVLDTDATGFPEDFLGTETYQVGSIIALADAFSSIMRGSEKGGPSSPEIALQAIQAGRMQVVDQEVLEALSKIVAKGRIKS